MAKQETLDFLRKEVSFLYREVGILKTRNHPELAQKSNIRGIFFSHQRKKIARDIYHQTKAEDQPSSILRPYEEETGLSLEEIHRIFAEGDWKNSFGRYSYGGPKWEAIAENALRLRDAIDQGDWDTASRIAKDGRDLEHNSGRLVHKFSELHP